jgi:hypothetical protein
MDGIEWTFRLTQASNLLILIGWTEIATVALFRLGRRQLDDVARVLWVIVIVLVPVFGALAFLIARPGDLRANDENKGC